MDSEVIELVKGLQQIARGLRTTGIIMVILSAIVTASVLIDYPYARFVVGIALGNILFKGVRLALGAHAVIKEIDRAALAAPLTPRRNTR